jgi:hypothetical protein
MALLGNEIRYFVVAVDSIFRDSGIGPILNQRQPGVTNRYRVGLLRLKGAARGR